MTKNVIIAVLSIILLMVIFDKCNPEKKNIIIKTDTLLVRSVDTIKSVNVRWRTVNDTVLLTKIDTLLLLDSAKCIQIAEMYTEKRIYKRELAKNDNIEINITDTIQFNSLSGGFVNYKIKYPNEKKFGAGFIANFDGVAVTGAYSTKGYMFTIGGDPFSKKIYFGVLKRF